MAETRTCRACGETREITCFYNTPSHNGRRYRKHTCRRCANKKRRKIIKAKPTPEWQKRLEREHAARYRARYPEKAAAKRIVRAAIENGTIVPPSRCQDCGGSGPKAKDGRRTIHAHHEDYSRPLDVAWLCQQCHYLRHRALTQLAREDAET